MHEQMAAADGGVGQSCEPVAVLLQPGQHLLIAAVGDPQVPGGTGPSFVEGIEQHLLVVAAQHRPPCQAPDLRLPLQGP
ncbi:MAG: hypothetical protein ACK559_21650, partial [bacterium]